MKTVEDVLDFDTFLDYKVKILAEELVRLKKRVGWLEAQGVPIGDVDLYSEFYRHQLTVTE